MSDWQWMSSALPPAPTATALPTTLNGAVAYYVHEIQAAGNPVLVGVYFFRKFIKAIQKDYIDLVAKKNEIENLRRMNEYHDQMERSVKDFPELQKYMNIVTNELMRVVPDYKVLDGKAQYEQRFLRILHYIADTNKMYFGSGKKKKTRKVRKQKRRKTRGRRLRK